MLPDVPEFLAPSTDHLHSGFPTIEDPITPHPKVLYEGASINQVESMVAIISFIQSEHLSGAGTDRLLSLIGLHLPAKNNFFQSSHELFKTLGNRSKPNVFYFCSLCLGSRASSSDVCDTCKGDKKTVHSFLHFPLEPQIAKLYNRPGFVQDIQYKRTRVKLNKDNVEDIYDSKCYQDAEKDYLSEIYNISFMCNTDGLQIFESSLMSMWVFYLVVNELPPHKRFLTENMLVAGIWVSSSKPHPNIFLQPIYKDMQTLKSGIMVKFFDDPTEHKIVGKLLCDTMDSPARALFLNMKTHSGFYSCFKCYLKGVNNAESGGVTVFPFEKDVPLRNLEDHVNHVNYAVQEKVIYKKDLMNTPECSGVKGPTLLFYLLDNMFEATAIDSMHCVYLGCMRQILNLMFDSDYQNEPFSVHSKISVVNSLIKNVHVPHFLERTPQGVDKLVHWKASELRTFMFYICLIVLHGVLRPDYFEHLVLFVHGVALLNTSSISDSDIETSTRLLTKFVEQFQSLYGLRHMSSNIHLLLHLPLTVRLLGPLCIISCFKFEDLNGRVLNLIHGTRHAGLQVCSNLSALTDMPLIIHNLENESVKKFCLQMRYKWLSVNVSQKISESLYCVGDFFPVSDNNIWIVHELVQSQVGFDPAEDFISLFHRLMKDRILYSSSFYQRNASISSYAKYYKDNTVEYGHIQTFVRVRHPSGDEKFYAVVKRFQATNAFPTNDTTVQHVFEVHPPHICTDVIDVKDLVIVLFKATSSGSVYISATLNMFELE